MEKVGPPDGLDSVDAIMGALVVVGGSFVATFIFGVLAYW